MYHVRLCKSLSYDNGKIKATKAAPDVYVEDEAIANEAVASGFFELVSGETRNVHTEEPEAQEETVDWDAIAAMTKAQLVEYAAQKGIDISKCKSKSDILAVISKYYGGSITMCELQEEGAPKRNKED